MYVTKNTSQAANVRNVRLRRTLSALQRAAKTSKKAIGLFDGLRRPLGHLFYFSIFSTAFMIPPANVAAPQMVKIKLTGSIELTSFIFVSLRPV